MSKAGISKAVATELVCRFSRLIPSLPPAERLEAGLILEQMAALTGLDNPAVLQAKLKPRQQAKLAKPLWPAPQPPVIRGASPAEQWFGLLKQAEESPVCQAHIRPYCKLVVGTGPLTAGIMLVGEGPRAEDELVGIPFQGLAGAALNQAIADAGFHRDQAYLTNLLLWRPQSADGNTSRHPSKDEIAFCLGFLQAQVGIVKPRVIVAMGAKASSGLLGRNVKITESRGVQGMYQDIPVVLTYSPAYVLRIDTRNIRRQFTADLKAAFTRALPPAESVATAHLPSKQ